MPATTLAKKPAKRSKRALRAPAAKSKWEEMLALQIRAEKLTTPMREFQFAPGRKWRADFAWPVCWPMDALLVEVEGGTWSGGRHTRGSGYQADCEKYNAAVLLGWRVLRYTGEQVKSGIAIREIKQALGG